MAKVKEQPFAKEIAGYDRVVEVLSIDRDDFAIIKGPNRITEKDVIAIFRLSDSVGFSVGHHIVSGGPVKPIRLRTNTFNKLLTVQDCQSGIGGAAERFAYELSGI